MKKYLSERLKSFIPAFEGVHYLIKNEGNAIIHLIASVIVLILSFILKIKFIRMDVNYFSNHTGMVCRIN